MHAWPGGVAWQQGSDRGADAGRRRPSGGECQRAAAFRPRQGLRSCSAPPAVERGYGRSFPCPSAVRLKAIRGLPEEYPEDDDDDEEQGGSDSD